MENARPVMPAGKISLNNNQDTVEENRISIKLLSCLLLLFRNETLCTTFLNKKLLYLHENDRAGEKHFDKNAFKIRGTLHWPVNDTKEKQQPVMR